MFRTWFVCLLYGWTIQVSATTTTKSTPLAATYTAVNSTCPSRTANYLTHSLPQQCLTSSRGALSTSTCNSTHADIPTTASVTASTAQPQNLAEITPTENYNVTTTDIATASSDSQVSIMTVTASAVANQALIPAVPDIIEEESSLEGGGFLSFEEWKKRNLQKAGQSEHLGRAANGQAREGRKRPPNMQHSLDSLGDDVEIDLDFTGFVPGGPGNAGRQPSSESTDSIGDDYSQESKPKVVLTHNKDAGTTCKERTNYASFDCAANMLKTNPQAKSPGAVLIENKDAYMLNECSAENKFMIIELCSDILVDTVVLANYEFFSSIFRTFRVSVSDRYPVKLDKWKTLGIFEARNTRDIQAFLIENPMIWARYLRIEFLTHYGAEYYCPVSLVRVHGTTMMEEYKYDLAASTIEEEEEPENGGASRDETEVLVPEAVDEQLAKKANQQKTEAAAEAMPVSESQEVKETAGSAGNPSAELSDGNCLFTEMPTNFTSGMEYYMFVFPEAEICSLDEAPTASVVTASSLDVVSEAVPSTSAISTSIPLAISSTASELGSSKSATIRSERTQAAGQPIGKVIENMARTLSQSSGEKYTTSTVPIGISASTASDFLKTTSTKVSEKTKQSSSVTQSPPASPTMQESFFKSVQKRLQMLESNSTLSLQYIEEQSRALRDAFRKVEQRQMTKTTLFLDHLNATVLKELREFRQQYDQLWQSTVIELAIQREQYQRENQAIHARLGVLADELIFQKRMSILQMTLILVCLGLVLFSRGVINNYLELPLVQSVLSRSPSSRWMNLSGDSSSPPPKLSRVRSAYQMGSKTNGILKGHRRLQSDDSNLTDTNFSTSEIYSPPTPVSYDGYSDISQPMHDDLKPASDPEYDPDMIERPSTSPPMLASQSDPTTPRLGDDARFASIGSRMITPNSSDEQLASPSELQTRSAPISPPPPTKHLTWDLPET